MDFRVLGPLEVVTGGRVVALGGSRQRVVLVRLLLRAGQTVPTAALIDEVWGDDPPEAARNSVQSYVSHLRKALGAGRIRTSAGGYALVAEPDEIDVRRFETLLDRARHEASTDPDAAAATLRRALGIWRGPALADLVDEPALTGEIALLEDLRLRATEHLLAAEIAAGRHSAVVGELEALTSRYQLRERFWAQLMLALYRSGRQAEALSAYTRVREVLASELGIDPSAELQELYLQILHQLPELAATDRPASPGRGSELSPGSHFGAYRIERILERGGMGIVYLAQHLGLERRVALKVIGSWLGGEVSFVDRFVRESRVVASLDHPNVIPIYEAGEEDGQPYIAMRYVEGRDLRRTLDEEGRLDATRAVHILHQVADGLDAAHARGVVHRDVKPANVLLTHPQSGRQNEHVYLVDFGLARRVSDAESSVAESQLVGTLDYTPPEVFLDEPLDGRADLYALACVLFESLTGTAPYRRPSAAALMRAHLEESPPAVTTARPDLPDAIDAVVARALAKSPDERFASCADFARAVTSAMTLDGSIVEPTVVSTTGERDAGSGGRAPDRRAGTSKWRRGRIAAAIGIAATIIAVASAIVLVPERRDSGNAMLTELPPGMAIIDATTGEEAAFIPSSTVRAPVEAIYTAGSFWVLNLEPLSFVQIEARTGEVLRQIASPIDDVGSYVVDGDTLWVTHSTQPVVSKVDTVLGREVLRFDDLPGAGGTGGVLVADRSLWVARPDADDGLGALLRVDPDTGEVQHEFRRLPGSYALAYGDDGAVWTAGTWGAVNRVDPRTNSVTTADVGGRNFYLAVGEGYGWTTDEAEGVVHQIDASGTVVATFPTGAGARAVSISDGVVWVGNQDAGTLTAIDAADGTATSYLFGRALNTIAAGDGRVLVQLADGLPYEGRIAALDGEVARLLVGSYALDPLDPALLDTALGRQALAATCAGLLRQVNPRAAAGDAAEPDVAATMPTLSADERTYTFTVRSGFQFSPPSAEVVTAETFRSTIERALSPRLPSDAPGPVAVGDIEGVADFRAGDASHISGLRVDGNELRITLIAPSPDFVERLATPTFCAVPVGTPIDTVGGGAAIPTGDATAEVMVPSAGPYYIARHLGGEYTILMVNPHYTGARPHRFDAIVLREGIAPSQARALVDAGEWDGITNMHGGSHDVDDEFADRIGCRSSLPDGAGIDLAALCLADSP